MMKKEYQTDLRKRSMVGIVRAILGLEQSCSSDKKSIA